MTATLIAESPDDGDLRVTVSHANIKALRSYAHLTRERGDVKEAQAMERYADALTARLGEMEGSTTRPTSEPKPSPEGEPVPKRRTALRVLVAILAALGALIGIAPHAAADSAPAGPTFTASRVFPTATPIRVVVAGPTVTVSTQFISTTPLADGTHAAALFSPGGFVVSGESRRRGPVATVQITGTVPSYLLTPGSQTWWAVDAGDESYVPVAVKVLRQGRFGRVTAVPVGGGRAFVSAALSHYNIPTGTWMGSKLSPVQVQYATLTVRGAMQWRTAGTRTTDAAGNPAAGIVSLPKGRLTVRLIRAEGANVTGVTSGTITVVVR
jgi:hypothetical protein